MDLQTLKKAKPVGPVSVCSLIYNEQWFLPHFLAHYRALGVEHFVFYDDRSADSTRDILFEQNDCTIIAPVNDDVPSAMRLQVSLTNFIEEQVGKGRWSFNADADEFLILPSAFRNLPEMTDHLDDLGALCAFAAMVDFYPRTLDNRFFDPLPPIEGCRYFDRFACFQQSVKQPGLVPIIRGVRARLMKMLAVDHPEIFHSIYGEGTYRVAKLWKVPLVKTGQGVSRTTPHDVSITPPESIQLALAHFKFYPQLDRRIAESLERGSHFSGALEYRFLKAVIEHYGDVDLVAEPSVQYRSPADLEEFELLFAR
jgi:hypothetical protein